MVSILRYCEFIEKMIAERAGHSPNLSYVTSIETIYILLINRVKQNLKHVMQMS